MMITVPRPRTRPRGRRRLFGLGSRISTLDYFVDQRLLELELLHVGWSSGGSPASCRSLGYNTSTVVEHDPAATRTQVVAYAALELLPLEQRTRVVCKGVEMSGQLGASGVGSRVDAHFDLVYEVEEGLKQGSIEVLAPYLLTHC